MSFLGELHALLAPSKRHELEERRRLELSRDEEGSADPHRGPIDLDSGTVRVRPRKEPPSPADSG
jgi:hypothetical protein